MNLQEEIAKVAHELFERDGRRHGLALDHWLEAERIVKATHSKKGKETSEASKPIAKAPAKTGTGKSAAAKTTVKKAARTKKAK